MADPKVGEMILFDTILPPLPDNSYRMTVKTDVRLASGEAPQDLSGKQAYFNIEGPRFNLPATEVGGVFPPRNGHGPFDESVPHIALYRRTLPWERQLESGNLIGTPTRQADDPPAPVGTAPWVGLLVFEESECDILQNIPLQEVVPRAVFERLGSPGGVTCDAVETTANLLKSIIPSKEELQLLTHVRQVNIDDRELSAGDSDGYFAVVMSNRLPNPDTKCRACLVSLEERADVVPKDPPPVATNPIHIFDAGDARAATDDVVFIGPDRSPKGINIALEPVGVTNLLSTFRRPVPAPEKVRLVLLYSWQFACIGPGTFQDLMQRVSVGMIGKLDQPGHPALTDTMHLKLDLQNRVGVEEKVLYRGPLVPFQLTRDTLGPYHSADQARRVTPETGAEDISYAAAFEVGRLLASADPRLAQELMRWRREAYKQSSMVDSIARIQQTLQIDTNLDSREPIGPVIAAQSVERIANGAGPIADPFGLDAIDHVIGMNPQAVQEAFRLNSVNDAVAILGGEANALGAVVNVPPQTDRTNVTIDQVAADSASLNRLNQHRDRIIENTQTKLGALK